MVVPTSGLFEAHLTVRDLDRSLDFYCGKLGLALAHRVAARNGAFLWMGGHGHTMLGLWGVGTAPVSMRLHIAFRVTLADVLAAPAKLRAAGIVPRDGGGGAEIDEPIVFGWMPAASVYFDDPDGHSLEYIAMLEGEARAERGVVRYSEWVGRK